MALPATASAWRTVRWLVKVAEQAIPPTVVYLLEQLDEDEDVPELAWVRCHVRFQRLTPSSTVEDYAQFKLDLLNITSGDIDTSWTAGDFAACNTAISQFLTTIAPFTSPSHTAKELRYYPMRFNSSDPGPSDVNPRQQRPFADTGPPTLVHPVNIIGTSATTHPYQVAATVTLRTPWPKHWGRIYLPGTGIALTAQGRFAPGALDDVANAAFDLQDSLADAGFLLSVPVAQASKQRLHALLGVSQLVVDDIPDVIRRRRPRQPSVRQVGIE